MSDSNPSVNVSSGSSVGVISIGNNVTISIGTQQIAKLPTSEDTKAKLTELIQQLNAELQKVPAENKKEVTEVVELTDSLIEQASAEKPKPATLKVTANGLLEATKAIAGIIPAALGIATQIAETITGLNP